MVATSSTVDALPSSQPEIFYRQTVFRIARNWARVPNASWQKVRDPLFTQCPHALTYQSENEVKIKFNTNGRLSVIGLGLYFLESKGCHAGKIVPYLLWVQDRLLDIDFTEREKGRFSKFLLIEFLVEKNDILTGFQPEKLENIIKIRDFVFKV